MPSYLVLTLTTAPAQAQPILQQLQKTFVMAPNIAGTIANSPELIKAFVGLFGRFIPAHSPKWRFRRYG